MYIIRRIGVDCESEVNFCNASFVHSFEIAAHEEDVFDPDSNFAWGHDQDARDQMVNDVGSDAARRVSRGVRLEQYERQGRRAHSNGLIQGRRVEIVLDEERELL